MQRLKKYLAVSLVLAVLPITAFIGTHFVLESDKSIYDFVPQGSDVIIEINTRNFISEIAYQRIYNEAYFHEKIVRDEYAEPMEDIGLDIFSSFIIFREQWAEKSMWMILAGYTNQAAFQNFVTEQIPNAETCFGDNYVLVQLTPYPDQKAVRNHMENILAGKEKSFKERADLTELFDRNKEVNCYLVPSDREGSNQLLSGNLSLDFLADQIEISGEFTPVSGFSENAPVAYALNEDAPFSLRSSLNMLKSVYWFSEDKIEGLPEYSQMALDYEGMNLFMVNPNLGYLFPFKQHPDLQAHFDIINYPRWERFFNEMKADSTFKIDTVSHIMSTNMGTYFNYNFNPREFELARNEIKLEPCNEGNLYFAFQMKVLPILENIKLAIDQENPPPVGAQDLGLMVVQGQIEELKVMSNIEEIRFELRLEDETNMVANGKIQMINRSGNSMIESVAFGSTAILFLADLLSSAETGE